MIIVICVLAMLCCISYLIFKKIKHEPLTTDIAKQPEAENTVPSGGDKTVKINSNDFMVELLNAIQESNRHLLTIKTILLIPFILTIIGVVVYVLSFFLFFS